MHLVRAVPVLEAGQPVRWVGTCTDIEDQRRTEELLRHRQKLDSIGVLAGGVAHDFNNLLVGIVGGVSYALQVLPEDDSLRPILELALKSGERGADLTRQLMAYAGQAAFHPRDVDVAAALRDNDELMRAAMPRPTELRTVIPPDLPPVYADPTQFQQVIMNLVLNAGEAIPPDRPGIIVISAETVDQDAPRASWTGDAPPGRYVAIEVHDNGTGIEPALLQKIFDPFFTTKFTGRGLGLAAVQGIVRSNHGAIEVESTVGKGSTFRVFLPARNRFSQPKPAASESPASGPAARILIVDDEPVVRSTAKSILQRNGHTVETASSGQEALERIAESPAAFSLVLLDLLMPGLSGDQTLDAIHSIRPDLPVAICSGAGENEIQSRFVSRGVAGFVEKPFRSDTLLRKVSEFLVPA
jgi:nitrogen-specific signal transduction histidine kinase/CheY-like chemotaxis protein